MPYLYFVSKIPSINWKIFTSRSRCHENFILQGGGGGGSIFNFRGREPTDFKLNQLHRKRTIFIKLCKGNLLANILKFIKENFDIYCQSKDMADFLRGKLEPLTLNACFHPLNSRCMLSNLINEDSTHYITISPGVIMGCGRSSAEAKAQGWDRSN